MGKGKYAITEDQLRILNREFKPKTVILKEQLITAVATNDLVKAKALLDQNVDVNLKFYDLKLVERTLLGWAIEKQNLQMVELLLDKGADTNIFYGAGEGSTALIRAVYRNNIGITKMLLEKNADPNLVDKSGWSAITYAVSKNTEILELLIEKNGSVNTINNNSVLYLTPLMKAIEFLSDKKALKVMQILLEHGANVDAPDANGDTLLNYAIKYHRIKIVEKLLEYKANADNCSMSNNENINQLLEKARVDKLVIKNYVVSSSNLEINNSELVADEIIVETEIIGDAIEES